MKVFLFIYNRIIVPICVWSWFYPVVLFEIIHLVYNNKYDCLSFAQLSLAFLFNYFYFNLRRDRLDLDKHHDIVNYVDKFKDEKFSLMDTDDYISIESFKFFRSTYFNTNIKRMLQSKIDRFLQSIKIFLIEPNLENKDMSTLPDGLKVFPSFITHQTVMFLTDKKDKLNVVKRFQINHELAHMHPNAMLPILLQEINLIPFFWVIIWALFTSTWTLGFFIVIVFLLMFIFFSDAFFMTKYYSNKIRVWAEVTADYFGLLLLTPDERSHPIWRKMPFKDPNLNEANNELRNKTFLRMLDRFEEDSNYKIPTFFFIPFPVYICFLLTIILSSYNIDTSFSTIKTLIGLCIILAFERLTNHRKILLLKREINQMTKCDFY